MSLDTRFSGCLHFLILISQSDKPLSSKKAAASLGTNPGYIRKLASSLKKSGLIKSRKGVSGFSLARSASQISFLDIAGSFMDPEAVHMFDIHANSNDQCLVGHYIEPVLSSMFFQLDHSYRVRMEKTSLQDAVNKMISAISQDQRAGNQYIQAEDNKKHLPLYEFDKNLPSGS